MKGGGFLQGLFWVMNILAAAALALGCIAFFLPAGWATPLSVFGFLVPFVLLSHLLFFFFWTFKWNRRAFLSLFCLLASFVVFGFFFNFSGTKDGAADNSFSVMSYNVRYLNKYQELPMANVDSAIINFVLKESPDILAVQESYDAMRRATLLDTLYSHKYVDFEYGHSRVINSIYSKYPIAHHDVIPFPKSGNAAVYADIVVENDTIRVYNVHLQSFSVVPSLERMQKEASGKLIKRIVRRLEYQESQAMMLREHMAGSPYPVVLMGDFNNTQFSKVYRIMKSGFVDSFLESGQGFGWTIKFFGFPMRIDYILADSSFQVHGHTNYDMELSDHYPIKAQLALKPK